MRKKCSHKRVCVCVYIYIITVVLMIIMRNYITEYSNQEYCCQIWPLYTSSELNLRDRILGEVEKNSFIAGHQARCPGQLVLKRSALSKGFQGKVYKDRVREGVCEVCDQLVDILLIGWW